MRTRRQGRGMVGRCRRAAPGAGDGGSRGAAVTAPDAAALSRGVFRPGRSALPRDSLVPLLGALPAGKGGEEPGQSGSEGDRRVLAEPAPARAGLRVRGAPGPSPPGLPCSPGPGAAGRVLLPRVLPGVRTRQIVTSLITEYFKMAPFFLSMHITRVLTCC